MREGLIGMLLTRVPAERIIFEAPSGAQQKWFVRHLGIDVNLGNVTPDDVIALETLRRGLRSDTAGLAMRRQGSRLDTAVYSTGSREVTLRTDDFGRALELTDAILAARRAA